MVRAFFAVCAAAFAIGILLGAPAYAADVCPAGTICLASAGSLRDILDPILLALGTILVGYAVAYLRSKWGINVSQSVQDQVNKAISDAAGLVLGRVENLSAFEIKVGNPLIADGANWALAQIPGLLAKQGITPDKERDWIADRIAAVLGHMTKDAPDTSAANPTRL